MGIPDIGVTTNVTLNVRHVVRKNTANVKHALTGSSLILLSAVRTVQNIVKSALPVVIVRNATLHIMV